MTAPSAPDRDTLVAALEAQLADARRELEDACSLRRAAEERARTAEAAVLAVRAIVDAVG